MIDRYSLPEMSAVWEERSKYRRWMEIELHVVDAWATLGVIPAEDARAIHAATREVDPARVEEIERTTNHDVIAFLTALGEPVGEAARWIHYGMTSSDLLDTALALQLREASDLLLARMDSLVEVLKRRALEFRDTVCVGRTHGVHGEPTTFGMKIAVWAFEAARARERLRRARETVSVGKIAGAVGTYATVDPAVQEHVCRALGLAGAEAATQVIQRDRHAEFVAACAITAATAEKIATEIRHLQRTEVREAEEPFTEGQKGSSAMPHKRNPIMCERICGLARVIRGFVAPAVEDIALWHERDISHSSVERVILPDTSIALDYILKITIDVLEGMRVYPQRMLANLEASGGLVYSGALLLEMVEAGMSREDAYTLVQRAAMRTWEDGIPFRDALMAEPEFMRHVSAEMLDEVMDPQRYLTHVNVVFKRLEAI